MAAPTRALLPAALCSTLAGGWESKGRDALRPDGFCRLRRAGPVKGGRRPGPDPRAATRSALARAWRARGGPTS